MRIPAMASLLLALLMAGTAHANEVSDSSLGQVGVNLPTVVVEAQRLSGPTVSETGAAVYGVSAEDIEKLPTGAQASITDVLAQMPSVAIDQNQQIHIRNTEGPQFQYQINGSLVPLDINTNPPFISMLNTLLVDRLDLRVGVLPARYGYATGGVIDVESKDGCRQPGGEFSVFGGQRGTISPSIEYAACEGALASYVSARETWSNTAFSSANNVVSSLIRNGFLKSCRSMRVPSGAWRCLVCFQCPSGRACSMSSTA
jgi:outer membrane cobalamin receptor